MLGPHGFKKISNRPMFYLFILHFNLNRKFDRITKKPRNLNILGAQPRASVESLMLFNLNLYNVHLFLKISMELYLVIHI